MERNRLAFVAGAVLAVEAILFGASASVGWATGATAGGVMGVSGAVLGVSAAIAGRRASSA